MPPRTHLCPLAVGIKVGTWLLSRVVIPASGHTACPRRAALAPLHQDGCMTTAAISAVVSAIVTVVVGTFINWGERIVTWCRRILTPDHVPIASGSGWHATRAASSSDQVLVLASCAPNRSLRRREIDPDRAVSLIRTQFAGLFPDEPVFSMPEHGVRFDMAGGQSEGYAWAHTAGRVDLAVHIPTAAAEPGPIAISILDVIEPVLRVLAAVRSSAYEATFGRRPRRFRHRFDWAIAVSSTIVVNRLATHSWQQLTFPGATPPRVGTEQQAYCPPMGYAFAALQNWDIRRPDADLVRVFLRDFLYQNGYHNVDATVADTLATLGPDHVDRSSAASQAE